MYVNYGVDVDDQKKYKIMKLSLDVHEMIAHCGTSVPIYLNI